DGIACSDGNTCTVNDACSGGVCRGTCYCNERAAGLVGWWPGDGNAGDISGNNYSGTMTNGAAFGPGKVAQAFQLDGVDDYVANLGDAAAFSFIESSMAFTIAAWIDLSDPLAQVQQAIVGDTLPPPNNLQPGAVFLWDNTAGAQQLRLAVTGSFSQWVDARS